MTVSFVLGSDPDIDRVAQRVATLTKRAIDALKPRAKPYIAFDGSGDLPGFGVRVMPSGAKSFILEYRVAPGTRAVPKSRITLGKLGVLTPDQARRKALAALNVIRSGGDPRADAKAKRDAITVARLIDLFVDQHVRVKCKPGRQTAHLVALGRLRSPYGGQRAESISRQNIASLHAGMSEYPYGANRMLAVISKCFAWGIARGLLPDNHINPARGIERYREQGRERFLTAGEFARLGTALREVEPRFGPYPIGAIKLLMLTGARLREILDARWSGIDFERGVLFLPDSKTGKKPVFLNEPALDVLGSLPRLAGCRYLFPGRKPGKPVSDLHGAWAAVIKKANLEGLRLHDLRHSFASVGAGASLGLPVIGKLLGHSKPGTTQRYAHLADDSVRQASESIGTAIAAAMTGGSKRGTADQVQEGRT